MSVPLVQNSFVTGEIAPALLGRQDVARYHTACTTMRNVFVSYKGPAYSRAGTAFCGFSKQTGRAFPPRLITFQFNVNQGLALEFGNFYMRVLFDGAFVTEAPGVITGVSSASPAVISISADGAQSATPVNTSVSTSYAPNDKITLAGGVFLVPAVLSVTTTTLVSITPLVFGQGFAPGDTVTLAGGVQTAAPVLDVSATQVVSATVAAAGSGGITGIQTVTGTTGTGTKFKASVTISGGAITAVNSITLGGAYSVNPANLAAEPVTGASLSGAQLSIVMGVQAVTVASGGALTQNPTGTMTQSATSGAGTGATFQLPLFGVGTVSVASAGAYTLNPANPVAQASSTGSGIGAEFNVVFGAGAAFVNGDWVALAGIAGPTILNGQTVVVGNATAGGFAAFDVYGNPISTIGQPAYTGGGTAARIFTLATQYAEADLQYLKVQESTDTMSICCVNQMTGAEYPAVDLERINNTDWVFTPVVPASSIQPPGSCTGVSSGTGSVDYQYCVTAVAADGTESVASEIANIDSALDIANTAGTNTITWTAVAGAVAYFVYKAEPSYSGQPPVGATFGFCGQSLGTQFQDSNIVPDFTQVPPLHLDPFARGQVIAATAAAGGSGYTEATATVTSGTGSGAILIGVIVNGAVVAWIIEDGGANYESGDVGVVSGDGTGATVTLTIGPRSGTYPSIVNYFQQRRIFANSLNDPDTYWMSQPGAFLNFDARNPTIASDAIVGSPWSVQVNGIQAMVQTSGGLLVMTGLSAWLLAGVGSFATNVQAISPSSQDNVPQAFSGCSPTLQPIRINYDVIYLTQKGSYYYDLPYQLYALSEPIDLTESSSHLFTDFTFVSHAWCEQPYKLFWAVRSDGVMLSLTYYKTQQIAGWARHDTCGAFVSNCSVTELPVDALYVATQRFAGTGKQCYMIERMDNRLWQAAENVWAVDAALSLTPPSQAAVLTISSANGLGAISGATNLVGGAGYSAATQVTVSDTQGGKGSGAAVVPTIVGGVIIALTMASQGSRYTQPIFSAYDPANSGSGFSARPVLANTTALAASSGVFLGGDVGSFVRAGGGIAQITAVASATQATANVLNPFPTIPDSGGLAQVFGSGDWSKAAAVASVGGLGHLIGQTVTGLADGNVIPPTVVSASGSIALPAPASAVIVGLGFRAQMQSVPLDMGQPTIQGQRKNVQVITARLEASLGVEAVANQTDGSLLSPPVIDADWRDEVPLPDTGAGAPAYAVRPYNALAMPLQTGDRHAPVKNGLARQGQVALTQDLPLPMNVLALIPEVLPGDTPQTQWPNRQQGGQQGGR